MALYSCSQLNTFTVMKNRVEQYENYVTNGNFNMARELERDLLRAVVYGYMELLSSAEGLTDSLLYAKLGMDTALAVTLSIPSLSYGNVIVSEPLVATDTLFINDFLKIYNVTNGSYEELEFRDLCLTLPCFVTTTGVFLTFTRFWSFLVVPFNLFFSILTPSSININYARYYLSNFLFI